MAKQDQKSGNAPGPNDTDRPGQTSVPEPHETPMPNKDSALEQGGDKSAVQQQAASASAGVGGDGSTAPLNAKVVSRERRESTPPPLPQLPDTALTVVDEDVYEEFFLPGSDRPLYRLRFARGQVVLQREYDAVTAGKALDDGFTLGNVDAAAGDARQQVIGQEGRVGGTVERD